MGPVAAGGAASAGAAGALAAASAAASPAQQTDTRLRFVLQTMRAKPVASTPCVIHLGQSALPVATDGSGKIEVTLPPGVSSGDIVVQGSGTTLDGVTIPFSVAPLPPVGTILGQEARLNNLGYRAGETHDPGTTPFRSAVEEFQCDEGLPVDGKCGPQTQAKLASVHGS